MHGINISVQHPLSTLHIGTWYFRTVADKLFRMAVCYICDFYDRSVIKLKEINMLTFIIGLFVGAFLGTLAVALCVASSREHDRGQSN